VNKHDHLVKLRAQLEKAGKPKAQLELQFAELESPVFNPAGRYLLNMFSELSSTRQNGMNGPGPITYLEMKAYSDLADCDIEPWEVEVIKLLDSAFMEELQKIISKEN